MESVYSVHKVLDLLITKAAVSAKCGKTKVRIPYKDLMASIGQTTDKQVDLIVSIKLAWDGIED